MNYDLKKIGISTVIPLIIILTLLSLGILLPILTMVVFGAILAYYIRFIAQKVRPYIKNDTLSVFVAIILFTIPIALLLYFTLTQFILIAESTFGSIQQAAAGNPAMTMTPISDAIQNLGLPGNVTQTIISAVQTGITQLISYVANSFVSLVSSIPSLAAQLLILIFTIFYFARDGDKVLQYVKDIIPDKDKGFYQEIFDSADDVLKSIIVGNAIPAIILGILSGNPILLPWISICNSSWYYKWNSHVYTNNWPMDSLWGHRTCQYTSWKHHTGCACYTVRLDH